MIVGVRDGVLLGVGVHVASGVQRVGVTLGAGVFVGVGVRVVVGVGVGVGIGQPMAGTKLGNASARNMMKL